MLAPKLAKRYPDLIALYMPCVQAISGSEHISHFPELDYIDSNATGDERFGRNPATYVSPSKCGIYEQPYLHIIIDSTIQNNANVFFGSSILT